MAKREGLTDVAVHAFMDGRDTPPHSGLGYTQELEAKIAEIGVGAGGHRYPAVTTRWIAISAGSRVEQAFRTVVLGRRREGAGRGDRRRAGVTSAARPMSTSCRPSSATGRPSPRWRRR
jgi:2,3-bisphosphoglycerate-independent phosphoglycerate mutase